MYRVLIAEDEMLVRLGIKSLVDWEKLGLELVGDVSSGTDALKYYQNSEQPPDILITDINMPGMDGLTLISEAKKRNHHGKFIVLTCLEEFKLARKAVSLGVSEYVIKLEMTKEGMEQILCRIIRELDEEKRSQDSASGQDVLISSQKSPEALLKEYLLGDEKDDARISKLLRDCENRFQDKNLSVMVLKQDKIFREDSTAGSRLTENILKNMVEEVTSFAGKAAVINEDQGDFFIVFGFPDADDKKYQYLMLSVCNRLISMFSLYFNVSCSILIGKAVRNPEELKKEYRNVLHLAEPVFFLKNRDGMIIWEEEIRKDLLIIENRKQLDQFSHKLSSLGIRKDDLSDLDSFIDQNAAGIPVQEIAQQTTDILQKQFYKLCDLYSGSDNAVRLWKETDLYQTLNEILAWFTGQVQKWMEIQKQNEGLSPELMKVINFVKQNYSERITLSDAAQIAGYNPSYLSQIFKKKLGISFVDYLNHVRIGHAKEMLADGKLTIAEISADCGYPDTNYFYRIFRKETGMSPRDYQMNSLSHTR